MKRVLVVALRNDDQQILTIETKEGVCNLPMYRLEASQSAFKTCVKEVRHDFGFEIAGLTSMRETFVTDGYKVEGMMAYITSGRLHRRLPSYRSVSWLAPTVLAKVVQENENTQHFIKELLWLGGVTPG